MSDSTLRRAGLILIATTVLAKIVGFLREAVIAATYGTSHSVDVYLAGMTLPAMVATIVFHSVPNAFVPLFSESHRHGQARRQAWGVLGVMSLLSACIWALAEPIASLTSSGFPAAVRSETVMVLRITSAAVALATIEALTRSRLLALRRFLRPGLSLIWQSVVMIIAVWLYPDGGPRTLAWGFVAGSAAAALWNLLPTGLFRKKSPEVSDPAIRAPLQSSIGLWVPIVLLADSIPQLYALVDRHLGSYLAEGSIAALQYANLIAVLPISICGLTLGTAIFPFLSTAIQTQDKERAADILDKAVRWSLILVVPVMIWLVFFRQEITGLLYERGAFNQESRLLTAATLTVYALGLIPNMLMAILAKVFYSSRRWGPVMLSATLSLAVKLVLSLWWVERHGTIGLAAATAAGSLVGAVVFLSALPREFTVGRWQTWARNALGLGATCTMGSAIALGLASLVSIQFHPALALAKVVCGVFISAAVVYWTASRMGLRELDALKERIGRLRARS